jgi:hypothetical protein
MIRGGGGEQEEEEEEEEQQQQQRRRRRRRRQQQQQQQQHITCIYTYNRNAENTTFPVEVLLDEMQNISVLACLSIWA